MMKRVGGRAKEKAEKGEGGRRGGKIRG